MKQTPLVHWHRENGGRMVEFGGWEMPIRYTTGIIGEHLATRDGAGLFDVSHMGRFRLRGPAAEGWLRETLTNDAAALAPGESQYTLIANEHGGAVDDAYLYRLAADDFHLVVNASNRSRDFEWLSARIEGDVRLADESEALAMLALQGPDSERILGSVLPDATLPEGRRNRHVTVDCAGSALMISRTGYAGERIGFELVMASERCVPLWTGLVAAGAAPVGLGARDTLRLQAGLPLYGHEFGPDPSGTEIPILANASARFGVRRPGGDADYPGRPALDGQWEDLARIRRGDAHGLRFLPRLIRPIAVFEGRRPLRAGQRVFAGERHAGYVTSGTSVPMGREEAGGRPVMRPIGLALLDSDLCVPGRESVPLRVIDGKGNENEAELVAGHR